MFDSRTRSSKKNGPTKAKKKKGEDHLEDPLTGSGTVMAAAVDSEYAFDDSFTPALIKKMKDDPKKDLDSAMDELSQAPLGASASDNDDGLHHPTIVAFGQKRMARGDRKAQKRAVLVANQKYKYVDPLGTPMKETSAFKSVLKGRGYKTKQRNNRTADSMTGAWQDMVGSAQQGDQLVAYFSGHGTPDGLVGIKYGAPEGGDDMVPYSTVSSIVSAATSKGANIRFIMDACHSGTGTQLVRSEQIGQLAEEGKGMTAKVVSLALTGLQDNRKSLMDHVHNREIAVEQANDRVRAFQASAPDASASPEEMTAYQTELQKLTDGVAKVEAAQDRIAKRLWKKYYDGLAYVAQIAGTTVGSKDITDFRTLGAQLKELDLFSNRLLKWGQDAEAEEAEAAK